MKNQLRTKSDVLKSSPVGENEVMKHDGRSSGSVFCLAHSLTDRKRERKVYTVHVMHSQRRLSLVSHIVAPMHSLQMLSRYRNRLLLSVMKEGERENGDVAAFTASSQWWGWGGGGGQTAVHCLQMLIVWMFVTKQREHLDASK